MNLSRRRFMRTGLAGVSLAALSACSTSSDSGPNAAGGGESKEMVLWTWPEGFGTKVLDAVKNDLSQYKLRQDIIGGDFKQKLTTTFTAGSGMPDVTGVKGEDIAFFRSQANYFEDLNQLGAGDIKGEYLDWKWQQATTQDGVQIGIPIDIGPTALFYRFDVFEEAGLPSEPEKLQDAIRGWDEYIELGKELMGKRPETFLIRNCTGMFTTIWSQSGQGFVDENDKFIGDQDHIRAAWDKAFEALDAGIVATLQANTVDSAAAVNEGKLPADFGASWHLADLMVDAPSTEGKWHVCEHPGDATNKGGSFLAVPKGVKDPAASFELVKFMLNPQNQAYEYEDKGNFPATPAAFTMPEVAGPVDFLGGQEAAKIFAAAAEHVRPLFEHAHSNTVDAPFYAQIENVESSGKDKEQAWKDAVADAKRLAEQVGLSV